MTQNEKNRNNSKKHLLLFSPLDWGLGHTTRSVPLLRSLLEQGFRIVVACDSTQKAVLSLELPLLEFTPLNGYDIYYGRSKAATLLNLARQLIKILTKIKYEKQWLAAFIGKNAVSAVISDNRYGFHHPSVPCIFLTHQLRPRSGMGAVADHFLQRHLYSYINQFSECWIPDAPGRPNLAGSLSHPHDLPATPLHYIGPLSRLEIHRGSNAEVKHGLLFLLSGPEPQRTSLEKIILNELNRRPLPATLVRGVPSDSTTLPSRVDLTIYNMANGSTISQLAASAAYVICRPGYTTIMDMVKLKKKMIVVPTPGQGEQEYLGRYLQQQNIAVMVSQQKFSLENVLAIAENFDYQIPEFDMNIFQESINRLTNKLISR